ncbi:hypothetical protein PgNI_05560, partial [Pyricularia grisea]|uniref:Uncharacterized protein n=1 Tax=Pyricularia grisea TaxID=148305 RepID=A0A6P8B6V7_PYRGI
QRPNSHARCTRARDGSGSYSLSEDQGRCDLKHATVASTWKEKKKCSVSKFGLGTAGWLCSEIPDPSGLKGRLCVK